jgi:hypothetical protein
VFACQVRVMSIYVYKTIYVNYKPNHLIQRVKSFNPNFRFNFVLNLYRIHMPCKILPIIMSRIGFRSC